jgi:Leucine-rich repeat (LRR) protein
MGRKTLVAFLAVIVGVGLTVFVPSASSTVGLVQCQDPNENPVYKDPNFVITLPWGPGRTHHVEPVGGYGMGHHTNACNRYWAKDYYALDFDLDQWELVFPVADGIVEWSGEAAGYGQFVYIRHDPDGDGEFEYESLYAHLQTRSVSTGDRVTRDTEIGKAGATGDTGGYVHLHFALYKGSQIVKQPGYAPYGGRAVLPEPFVGAEEYTDITPGMALTSAGSPTLNFTVRLQGRPDNHGANVTIEVRNPGSNSARFSQTVTTDSNGRYNGLVLTGVPPGNYDIYAKTRASLRGGISNRTLYSGSNTLDFGTLLVGDLNGDNKVNSIDYAILCIGWRNTWNNPQPCPDNPEDCHIADFNLDSKVNSFDHWYIFNNWGREGQGGIGGHASTAHRQTVSQPGPGNAEVKITYQGQTGSTHNVGDTFYLDIEIRTLERELTGVDLIVHYDRCVLEALEVIPGSAFPSYVIYPVDPSSGELEISGESSVSDPFESGYRFDVFASVRFRVKMNTPNDLSVVYLEYKSASTVDSNAAEYASAEDVLNPPLDHVLHLQGSPSRGGIVGSLTWPAEVYLCNCLNEDRILVAADVSTPCAEVDHVSFSAHYDDSWHSIGGDYDGSDGWSVVWDASSIADQVVDFQALICEYAYSETRQDSLLLDRTSPGLESFSFSPPSPSSAEVIRIDADASDNLSEVEHIDVYVNTATDGSTSGSWNYIGTINGASGHVDWDTSGYANGVHRVVFDIQDNASNWDLWTFGSQPTATYELTEIPQAEYEALEALYNSTDGPNWSNNSGWLDTDTPCNWYGVTCSGGHVTGLNLNTNQLSGSIPPELGNLANLQDLHLSHNQLSGSIPPQLGNLTNLQDLSLAVNQLSGSILPELGNLTDLQSLYLNNNQLTGSIPPELGNLANLQYLDLCWNPLNGNIPPELSNLTNLQSLYLNYNQLTGSIPRELGNLANLEGLYLIGNELSGSIPPELGNLTDLQYLYLYDNQLTSNIPPDLGNLANLQDLCLASNQLSGSIPPELGSLTNLEELELDNNQLSGSIPLQLCNLTNLQVLCLDGNQLSGSILSQLGNLTNLQVLWLGVNQLSGSIPIELGNLTNLHDLRLDNNQLTGSIPPELGNLTDLQFLHLDRNQLSGSIPPELGNLANLQYLYLHRNQLSGSIPPELGNLANLTWLWLDRNQLSGSIPPELGNLTNLQHLYLHINQLSSSIPPELGNLANLTRLLLYSNQLSGSIPAELGNLVNLIWLYLYDNQFSRALPGSLTNLVNLDRFYFYNTDLCEPADAAFQTWLAGISDLRSTGVICCVLFGDVDEDGDVDVEDIMLVASRWHTSCDNPDPDNNPDTPNYEARYDLDDDCDIDVVDIMLVAAHWGETCP